MDRPRPRSSDHDDGSAWKELAAIYRSPARKSRKTLEKMQRETVRSRKRLGLFHTGEGLSQDFLQDGSIDVVKCLDIKTTFSCCVLAEILKFIAQWF